MALNKTRNDEAAMRALCRRLGLERWRDGDDTSVADADIDDVILNARDARLS